ncbi:MAG TPA: dodecin family protein [Steroidobacteraceae bacterium]|nr:dodecin family protein [Steroidobacteraceae bacterium]
MSVAKVTEIISTSQQSFDDAIVSGVKRATETLKNVTSAWVADQEVDVNNGKIVAYKVRLKVTFVLEGKQ